VTDHDGRRGNNANPLKNATLRAKQAARSRGRSPGRPGQEDRLPARQEPVDAAAERKLKDIPRRYRGIYIRAINGRSRAAAIHAQCLECMGWQPAEAQRCTCPACALYPYRPGTERKDGNQ